MKIKANMNIKNNGIVRVTEGFRYEVIEETETTVTVRDNDFRPFTTDKDFFTK